LFVCYDILLLLDNFAPQSYPTSTLTIAAGAYYPESGYDSLDFSMPTYKVQDLSGFPQTDDVRPGEPVTQEKKVVKSKKQEKKASGAEISAAKVAKAKADRVTAQAEQVAKMDALKAEKRAAKQ
jgi:hypothetical protein